MFRYKKRQSNHDWRLFFSPIEALLELFCKACGAKSDCRKREQLLKILLIVIDDVIQNLRHQMHAVLAEYVVLVHRVREEINLLLRLDEFLDEREVVLLDHDVIAGAVDQQ